MLEEGRSLFHTERELSSTGHLSLSDDCAKEEWSTGHLSLASPCDCEVPLEQDEDEEASVE